METEALGLAKIVSFSFIVSFTFLWRQYTETQIVAMLKLIYHKNTVTCVSVTRNLFLFLTKYIYILTKLQHVEPATVVVILLNKLLRISTYFFDIVFE